MSPAGFREIKVFEAHYQAIHDKRLTFLICESEPMIALGDILKIKEWSAARGEHTGRTCYVQVTYLIADPLMGLRVGYVAVQIKVKILTERTRA